MADNMLKTLPSHVDTTSTTQKSTSSIHSSQQDTITSNRTNKRRKPNHNKRNDNRVPPHGAPNQHNNAHNIYAPNSTPQATTNAPPYDHNHPPTSTWGGPPPQRLTPQPNPHTPTSHFSPYIHNLNPQPPNYTANSPHRHTPGDKNTHNTTTPYLASNPGWPQTGQQPRSRAPNPSQPVQHQHQIPHNFISQTFPNVQPQSRAYLHGIRRMPSALIKAISQSPTIIDTWRNHRHQHLQALIHPLTRMYGFHGPEQMTRIAEWLESTWAYEIGFLQPPQAQRQEDYFPHSCPICDPSSPKDTNHRTREVQSLVEYRTGPIPPGDPITYSMNKLQKNNDWNDLNLAQLYRHVRMKVDTCPLHNIYEVILYVMYHQQILHLFPTVRDPCDGFTRITTPTLNKDGTATSEDLVRVHPYHTP